jgi:hypothetical protein
MALMTEDEYGDHRKAHGLRGISQAAVNKAWKAGRITKVLDPVTKTLKIDPSIADAEWARNTDIDQQMRGNGGVLPLAPRAPQPGAEQPAGMAGPPPATATGGGAATDDLREELLESKLRQQRADTELRELELAERRGELVSVDEQRKVSARRYRAIRDQVLGIPDRLAWLTREDRLKLAAELKRVLHELSLDAQAESDAGEQPAAGTDERVAA